MRRIHLPAELVDLTCSYMEKDALAACSTVSRHWANSAQPQLFHTISLIQNSPGRSHDLSAFYAFLHAEPPSHLVHAIRELRVVGYVSEDEARFIQMRVSESVWITVSELAVVLPQLPSLKVLELKGICLDNVEPPIFFPKPKDLHELRLVSFGIFVPEVPQGNCSFPQLLNMFASVDILTLQLAQALDDSVPRLRLPDAERLAATKAAGQSIANTFHIGQLVIPRTWHWDAHEMFFSILRNSQALSVLHRAVLQERPATSNALIEDVKHTLRDLSLTISRNPPENFVKVRCLVFQRNVSLLTLHLI